MIKQTENPVVPLIPLARLRQLEPAVAVEMLNKREALIQQMMDDPFYHAYTPERWRLIDLAVARKRLQLPGKVIELIVMGGHDGGKTFGCVLRLLRHFLHTPKAACWGLQSTETNSQEVHQQRMYEVFPQSIRASLSERGGAKARQNVSLKFGEGKGFTNNRFTYNWSILLPGHAKKTLCGGVMSFKFYESKVKNVQGAKLTAANSDELVDGDMAKTVRQRMIPRASITTQPEFLHVIRQCVDVLEAGKELTAYQQGVLYTSVHLVGFTPIDGYSPFVADVLDGAVTVQEEDAAVIVPIDMPIPSCFPIVWMDTDKGTKKVALLPTRGADGEVTACKQVPVLKQPAKATQLVAYLPTPCNPWTNVDGKLADLEGSPEDYIRMTFFGDVTKNWQTAHPKFKPAKAPLGHVVDWSMVPKEGTWYRCADFAEGRTHFVIWALVDPADRVWVCHEFPQEGDYITTDDVGDPGAWAITSKSGKMDGDKGPAQAKRGFGFMSYKLEWERIENKLHRQWKPEESDDKGVKIFGSWGDSRLGNAPTPTLSGNTSILDEFAKIDMPFDPADGARLANGDAQIDEYLNWDTHRPMGPDNTPRLFIHEQCKAIIFALCNYTGKDGAKGACKDPRDALAMLLLKEPSYFNPERFKNRTSEEFGY